MHAPSRTFSGWGMHSNGSLRGILTVLRSVAIRHSGQAQLTEPRSPWTHQGGFFYVERQLI